MKIRKSISYAYPSSSNAATIGRVKSGGWYVAISTFREGASWSPNTPVHNAEGFASPYDPDLLALYRDADGEPCPYFLRHGDSMALRALADYHAKAKRPKSRKSAAQRLTSQI